MNNKYPEIGLYDHNADSYDEVKASYEAGNNVVGIVHATGTGKSFNALQLAYDNKDKKTVYVVPSNGIIEHLKEIINSNPNLDMDRDFPNLEFRTYQSFISLERDEISDINCDLLILDEFHHIGAPVWGARINTMIETHPNIKVFGMTAYTVRDRGTSYERDMANPDTDELFSNKIVSRYDLCDAMVEGVLPKPIYKSAYINLMTTEKRLEERVLKLNPESKDYKELMSILSDVKKRIHEAPGIPEVLSKNLKPNGKYIYFCPPAAEDGTNDIETIKKQALEWFKDKYKEEDIIFYTSTSEMGIEGKKNRDAFYKDVTLEGEDASNKLRIMFAINQYNEGIHAPNIDGVILGRGTCSDIIYFEQLGRALSVRGNTKEKFEALEKLSIEELIKMCNTRDIPLKEGLSKEEIIEKLLSPVVIDLTNNIDFIRELENRLRDRIREYGENGAGIPRCILKDASFDIEMVNDDLFELLKYVTDRLTMTWEDYYELAKAYYEKNGNLLIPRDFKTINGYEFDNNGVKLGSWLANQRNAYFGRGTYAKPSEDRIKQLEDIGMIWDVNDSKWERAYELAKAYYEHYGNSLIPKRFKTKNGVDYDENGFALGHWILGQRNAYFRRGHHAKQSEEQIKQLEDIEMVWDVIDSKWERAYELAKAYYEHYDNLLIPGEFKTKNGVDYDEDGFRLGIWLANQRSKATKLSEEKIKQLKDIGMVWDVIDSKWERAYELAKAYYEHYDNLLIPGEFKTKNGIDYDEDGFALGNWVSKQRRAYSGKGTLAKLSVEKVKQLEKIGMIWGKVNNNRWERAYELAKAYYEHHGNLLIPIRFKSKNGVDYDEDGFALGSWVSNQRRAYSGKSRGAISEEQIKLLEDIGMVWEVKKKSK